MKQSEAVFKATMSVLEESGKSFEPGHDNIKDIISPEEQKQVVEMVTSWIESGDCAFSDSAQAKYPTTDDKRGYVRGMVNNWYRKGQDLNGGVVYKPKNPGSRVGSQDEEVKNLKLLLKSGQLDAEGEAMVQARIDQRIKEIQAERNQVDIDYDALDPELIASLGIKH